VADIRLYVDAVLQAQQTVGAPGVGSLANSVFLEVGWQPGTTDEPVALDELEIFNVALAPSDVGAIFNAGSGGKCKCTTGGQSVDLTVAASGALFGGGFSVPAVVSGPLSVNYAVQGCGGHEMFVILRAPAVGILNYQYYSGALGTFLPLPNPLSFITPFVTGGPATTDGSHTLFSGTLPAGTYD